jgi:hypothetical protein
LLTGVVLGRTEEPVIVTGGVETTVDLRCEAHAVDVSVTGTRAPVHVDLFVPPENFP